MDKKKFESMLILIVPVVVKLIVENYTLDEIAAADMFYNLTFVNQTKIHKSECVVIL